MTDDGAGTVDELRATAVLLMAVAERVREAFGSAAARSGLSATQGRALLALREPTSMRCVAGLLHCDASNVTGIADRLEDRGLLERTAAAGDRRVKVLALTDAGHEVRATLEEAVVAGSPVRAALDTGQRALLVQLLRTVVERPDGAGRARA